MRTTMHELTLKSALSDPLIRTLMAADNVDPVKLESMLMRIAGQVTPSRSLRGGRLRLSGVISCVNRKSSYVAQ
jgi:hypothetical protein